MDNLIPKSSQKSGVRREEHHEGKGVLGPLNQPDLKKKAKSRPTEEKEPILGGYAVRFLGLIVVALSFGVLLLVFWNLTLATQQDTHTLSIRRLEREISELRDQVPSDELLASLATMTYAAIPEHLGPRVVDGAENPTIAQQEQFDFEVFFRNSEMILSERTSITYYICNDLAALRLIRDSKLPYIVSRYSADRYNLLLFGDYRPQWVETLKRYHEDENRRVLTQAATPDTTEPSILPAELKGLYAEIYPNLFTIQIVANTNLDQIRSQANILRNEGIPCFLYSVISPTTRNPMYSLQVGQFPVLEESRRYMEAMNSQKYLELIRKQISDRYIRKIM